MNAGDGLHARSASCVPGFLIQPYGDLSPFRFSGQDAFRWTAQEGKVNLGAGAATVSATDVSADGSIIVGAGLDGIFVWDVVHGLRSFRSIFGLNYSDWQSIRSEGISDDGTTIVGWGTHVSG